MFFKILFVLSIVLEFVFVPLFLKYYWPERCKKSWFFKMVCSTLFVLCGVSAMQAGGNNSPYAKLMIWGLVFGWIGDLLLHALSNKMIYFVTGTVAFLTGHIFYIVALQKAIKSTYPGSAVFEWYEILATVIVIGVVAFIAYKNNIFKEKGIIAVGAMAYGAILMTMLAKAARFCIGEWAYGTNNHMALLFVVVLPGAILFAVSDILLGYIIGFKCKKRIVRVINIVTYFAAQILLASSILFVESAMPLYS